MKKLIILVLSAWIFQSCVSTKHFHSPKSLDAVGGIGMTHVLGSKSWLPKMGGQIGVQAPLLIFDQKSSIKTGVEASFQGASWKEEMVSGKVNTTYLNIPVLYTFEGNNGFYGEAGLQPGFLLSAKDKYENESYDYKDFMNKFDLGIPIGGGYIVNDRLQVGARATFGLLNNSNSEYDDKNNNLLITGIVRYRFNLSNKNSGKE
jgi:hypothetical protein